MVNSQLSDSELTIIDGELVIADGELELTERELELVDGELVMAYCYSLLKCQKLVVNWSC